MSPRAVACALLWLAAALPGLARSQAPVPPGQWYVGANGGVVATDRHWNNDGTAWSVQVGRSFSERDSVELEVHGDELDFGIDYGLEHTGASLIYRVSNRLPLWDPYFLADVGAIRFEAPAGLPVESGTDVAFHLGVGGERPSPSAMMRTARLPTGSSSSTRRRSRNKYEPAVLGLADGSFVIIYPSHYSNASASYSYDVLGQRYAANGTPIGGEFAVNTLVSGQQFQPQLSALSTGGFVAMWTDTSGDASGYGIVAQRFAADGSKVGGEIPVNTTITGTQQGSAVAGLAGGGFVATWHYNNHVYLQRFDASGNKLGAEHMISTQDTGSNYSSYARDGCT